MKSPPKKEREKGYATFSREGNIRTEPGLNAKRKQFPTDEIKDEERTPFFKYEQD